MTVHALRPDDASGGAMLDWLSNASGPLARLLRMRRRLRRLRLYRRALIRMRLAPGAGGAQGAGKHDIGPAAAQGYAWMKELLRP